MFKIHHFCFLLAGLAAAAPLARAQDDDEVQHWNLNAGGGFSFPTGEAGKHFDWGWHGAAGAGWNPTARLGILAEYQYNRFTLSDATLTAFHVPSGDSNIWHITGNGMFRFNPGKRIDGYVIGGYGFYRRRVNFPEPTTSAGLVCDAWLQICPPGVVPVNYTLGPSITQSGGVNVGGGGTYRVGEGPLKIYGEVRAHWMFSSPGSTTFIPITFGVRW
jgi:hypothetical protein